MFVKTDPGTNAFRPISKGMQVRKRLSEWMTTAAEEFLWIRRGIMDDLVDDGFGCIHCIDRLLRFSIVIVVVDVVGSAAAQTKSARFGGVWAVRESRQEPHGERVMP